MVLLSSNFALAAYIAFIISVSASPIQERSDAVHSVKITKPANKLSAKDLLSKEKDRINSFIIAATTGNAPATNADVSYYVTVKVGSQDFNNMIVDTGSSITWVGAGSPYTGSGTGNSGFSIIYGSGGVSGTMCVDNVTVGGLTVTQQSFGSASSSSGFSGADGVFGVGPVDLTEGIVPYTDTTIPTFLDNLYYHKTIRHEVLGVYFKPESGSDTDDQNGEITLGGIDPSRYRGALTYFAKSAVSPYLLYWGINVASVKYGSTTLSSSASAIVDTGTTLIYIPTSAYKKFLSATRGTTDPSSGLAVFSKKPTGIVTFTFGWTGYPLTPSQYLVPSAQYRDLDLRGSKHYSWINDGGSDAAEINLIIGQKFLENYYSVFDTTNSRIGFATRA